MQCAFRLRAMALMVALAGCASILGADFDREVGPDGATGHDGGSDASDAPSDAARDSGRNPPDAAMIPVVCGDSAGLQAGAPWPTGGACNTRASRVAAPPLLHPRLVWRYNLGVGTSKAFMTSPIVAADGAVYAIAFNPPDRGTLAYALVAVNKNGSERFRAPLTVGAGSPSTSSPSIAKDGTVYVASFGFLAAFDGLVGTKKWERSVGTSVGSSPTLLSDGSIVVTGSLGLYAFDASGAVKWQKVPAAGGTYAGSVGVLPSGILVVNELLPSGTAGGALQLFTPEGNLGRRLPLAEAPSTAPLIDETSRIVTRGLTTHYVFTSTGATDNVKAGVGLFSPHPFGALAGSLVWYSPDGAGTAVSLDLASGATAEPDELESPITAFAVSGDGTLVYGQWAGEYAVVGRASRAGGVSWRVPIEDTSGDPTGPAIGLDGTVYLPWGEVLYAIGDEL